MPFDKTAYDMDYARKHITRKHIVFNDLKPEDRQLLGWLNKQPNTNFYIKELIRSDLTTKLTTKNDLK